MRFSYTFRDALVDKFDKFLFQIYVGGGVDGWLNIPNSIEKEEGEFHGEMHEWVEVQSLVSLNKLNYLWSGSRIRLYGVTEDRERERLPLFIEILED